MSLLDYFLKRVVIVNYAGESVEGVLVGWGYNTLIVHARSGTTVIHGYDTIKET